MESTARKLSASNDEWTFADECRALGINPWKGRYWIPEVCRILGISQKAYESARERNKTPYGLRLFKWAGNGRSFVRRDNLVEVFNSITPIT